MNKGCILGGGPAGLIAGYYFPDYFVLDEKPLGQLNLPFIPGPRLIQRTENSEAFVRSVLDDAGLYGYKINRVIAKVGYEENGHVDAVPPKGFKNRYTKITRGKSDSESSYLSEGKNEIEHLEINGMGENSYKFLFKTLLKIIEDRGQLKRQKVTQLNPAGWIHASEGAGPPMCYQYDTIINTLSLKLLTKDYYGMGGIWKGDELKDLDLTTLPKCFYQTNKGERSMFDYVYGYEDGWTRKTYFDEYMVYESVEPLKDIPYPVINQFENLPIQIKNSLDLDKFENTYMLGRFAQWNHKVKANEVIDRVLKWIN